MGSGNFEGCFKRYPAREAEKNGDYCEVLHAPYVKGFSEGLQRKLSKVNIGFVP